MNTGISEIQCYEQFIRVMEYENRYILKTSQSILMTLF